MDPDTAFISVSEGIRIVLLCGGNKHTQAKDIKAAQQLDQEWSDQNG
jgi:putative component of toxin-antitoxin plasmid stabilization module